jgi:phage/plasmid-associated DNA primase
VELLSKLTTPEEKSGFLNMLLKNAQVLIKRDFKFTHYQSLEKTKSLWREKSDSVSAFVESEVVINPNSVIQSVVFYEYYRKWCQENDEKITTIKMFYAKLVSLGPFSKGYSSKEKKSIRVIRGCTTKSIITEENKAKGQTNFT